ncbi:unnamed protein product [Priceomyces carsonii]|nr:unnamed protein product [Priceomyces carsonii]
MSDLRLNSSKLGTQE